MIKNTFELAVCEELITRLNSIQSNTKPLWGKMNAAQMAAHCCVTYEMVYTDKHPKAKGFKRFLLKIFVKNIVVGEKPYKQNSMTSPEFIMSDDKDFNFERERLKDYILLTQKNGVAFFEGRASLSFGNLTSPEWNNMFYKHLDHHLKQFGA